MARARYRSAVAGLRAVERSTGAPVVQEAGLRPMPLPVSLALVGALVALGVAGLYLLLPALLRASMPALWAYTIALAGMFPVLLAAALLAYRLEGRPFRWRALARRFRIYPMGRQEWAWTAGLLLAYIGGQLLLMPTARWLASVLPLPLPEGLPYVLDPRVVKTAIPTEYLGVPLRGNGWILLWYVAIVALNIAGEEAWWRGIILPRQELAHSRHAWLIHGLLWTLFHAPMWWNLIALLPSTLSQSFVTSRLKNSTPGIIVHTVNNSLGIVLVLIAVLGIGG